MLKNKSIKGFLVLMVKLASILFTLAAFIIINNTAAYAVTINGTLEPSDGRSIRSEDHHYTDLYTFTLNSTTQIQISMTSTFNDDRIFLYQGSIPTNDAYMGYVYTGDLLNSELDPGTYCIEVTSGNAEKTGSYTLTSTVELSETKVPYQYLDFSNTLESSDGRSIRSEDHHYTDLYAFTLNSKTRVQIWMNSTFNDDRIFLYRGSTPTNDAYMGYVYTGDLLNSELDPGTYCIEVTSGNAEKTGSYTLSSTVELSETKVPYQYLDFSNTLESSDGRSIRSEDHHYTDLYTFTLNSKTRVQIWMNSTFNDDRIFLYRGSTPTNDAYMGYVYTGDLLNSELDPGTYCIEVTSGNAEKTGSYTLSSTVMLSETKVPYQYFHCSGILETSDILSIRSKDPHYTDLYTFTLNNKTRVQIWMTSTFNDDRIFLYRGSTPTNDAYMGYVYTGDLLNSELDPGTYCIEVTSGNAEKTGSYELTSTVELPCSTSTTTVAPISPTIAQTPMSGPPGTTFTEWGTGFSPNSTATLHFEKPDGTEYPTSSQTIDSIGHFEITYTAPMDKPAGVYTWWAIDGPTGTKSNEVSYEVTSIVTTTTTITVKTTTTSVNQNGCDWSVGRYLSGSSIQSNPLPTGECTWYVDGKTDGNGWDLIFSKNSGRDAYKWYTQNLITNASQGTIGNPGDIMVLNQGNFSSVGHVAFVIDNGLWNGKRAWTVRHANWSGTFGQTSVETVCGETIKQCTFVEDTPGNVKIQNGESLGATAYPLLGFLYQSQTTSTTTTTQPSTTTTIPITTTTILPDTCPAEAIYGENADETKLLREYRDNVLRKTPEGQDLIKTYYRLSPKITGVLEQNPSLKVKAKIIIDSLLPAINKKVEESNEEQ